MAARSHRKGFKPLPEDGWQSEERDGSWEDYVERCVHMGAAMKSGYSVILWKNDNGQFHRLDGPAREFPTGSKEWFVNGQTHRDEGPARIWPDGVTEWFNNGECHRLDGPAIEYSDGYAEYWKEGIRYTDLTFTVRV